MGNADPRTIQCPVTADYLDEYETEVEEMERAAFESITNKYNLLSKIGEGTFSTVYKAEDLEQKHYDDSWIVQRGGNAQAEYYVAIKRIYVTSSPARIQNELEILRELSTSLNILPLITAFRHEDQVFIVLPYFKHPDFRTYYKDLPLRDIRYYMRSLFLALDDVHGINVIHRDIKPNNFLYDVQGRRGELVDFGLAERVPIPGSCPCRRRSGRRTDQMGMYNPTHAQLSKVYLKDDKRPSKRANRAGTRGFRAPEVLFKCDTQMTAVDIWSAGVILLTFLTTRFPFFNSVDDIEALIEITAIFGTTKMKNVAAQHNCSFETNIPTFHEGSIPLTRIVNWSTDVERKTDDDPDSDEQKLALSFLQNCLTLDPWQRWTAEEALRDPFLSEIEIDEQADMDADNAARALDLDSDMAELQSAADIDSPATSRTEVLIHQNIDIKRRQSDGNVHQITDARLRNQEMLAARDISKDDAYGNIRRLSARDARESQQDSLVSAHQLRPGFATDSETRRARSTNELERPTTPLKQILPKTPTHATNRNLTGRDINRGKDPIGMSSQKTSLTEVTTIDPRLTQYTQDGRL